MSYVNLSRYGRGSVGSVGVGVAPGTWMVTALWVWEDGGWSQIKHDGPYQYPDGGPLFLTAYPFFDEIGNWAPPYYYAASFTWNGTSWALYSSQCNGVKGEKHSWCAQQ